MGPTSSAPTSPAETSEPAGTSDLEGAWQTEPISLKDMVATLRRHGLGRHVEGYQRLMAPYIDRAVLTLTIENGEWDLYAKSGDESPEPIDYNAEYEITGDTVVFHHSEGSNFHRWQVDGDTLTFEFVRSTLPGVEGIPEEAFQRALYMTAEFSRQS